MIICGDAYSELKKLKSESVDCCVTSPPYYALRHYGVKGQYGLESTVDDYLDVLRLVFQEVRRVLKKDGTLWLNMGDSYASSGGGAGWQGKHGARANRTHTQRNLKRKSALNGLKPKDLIGIPWEVAFTLRKNGWFLRQDIVWSKPNPMPESVKDRCSKSHEYIFLFSKSKRYHFDWKAIQEPAAYPEGPRNKKPHAKTNADGSVALRTRSNLSTIGPRPMRAKRSVWTVTTRPFKGAHFATFPPDLIAPCILAGCKPRGVVLDPFFGSGTVGVVAQAYNRKFIGIELNPKYVKLATQRVAGRAVIPIETKVSDDQTQIPIGLLGGVT